MPADIMRLWSLPLPPPSFLHLYPTPLLCSFFATLFFMHFVLQLAVGVGGLSINLVVFYILLMLSKSHA